MGTHSTQIFGRFSRASALLVGMVLATAALSLVVVFSNPKPAEAIGETWYGTVEFGGTGEPRSVGGGTHTSNSYYRFEAPTDSSQATLFNKLDETWTFPAPAPGECKLVEHKVYGSGTTTGSFYVHETDGSSSGYPAGYYRIEARGSSHSDQLIPITETKTYAGTDYSSGEPCAKTYSTIRSWSFNGDIYSYQNPQLNFRSGSSVTPVIGGGGYCLGRDVEYTECGDMRPYLAWQDVQARWNVSRNVCSGYSRKWDIGKQDTLFLFNNCQTKSLSSRTSFLDNATGRPQVCDWSFVKRVGRACTVYKAILQTEWAQNDWFMYLAANTGDCGVWVVDDASWRPPKIKPATDNSDGQPISAISPGRTDLVRTATGSVAVTCPG